MPGITGQIVDENGTGLSGITVELVQFKAIWGRTPAGKVVSDASGKYTVTTSSTGTYHVKFKSSYDRLLAQSDLFQVGSTTVTVPNQTIPQATVTGWLITNLDPAGNNALLSSGNAVTFLVDDATAWPALAAAVEAATKEINFQQLIHNIDPPVLITFNPDPPTIGTQTKGSRLEELLASASSSAPPITVRYVIWDPQSPVPGEFATADAVENYFPNSIFPNTVEVRRFATNYTTPMHGKLITIDSQEAHILGSPIDQKYFDTTDHMISEPRRGAATGSGITTGVHDCSIKIVGPVVEHLRQTFFLQWNNVKGKTPVNPIPQMPTPPPSGDNVSVQIARTMPGDSRYNEVPKGETGMLEAYLRAFALATDYVYMESQYFQAQDLIAGIRLALQQNKNLQFIILINHEPDLIFYKRTQNLRIRQLIDGTTKDNTRNRLGLFTLWKHEAATPLNKIISIYIHAKLAVIDDKWAAVGTSNLDGTSLNITDWYSTLDVPLIPTEIVRESDEHRRSVEVNAVIFDGTGTNQPPNGMAEQLRRQLWAEHLGLDSSSSVLDPANRPAKGWLDLWNTKADAFKAALNANPPDATEKARILAWNAETDKNVKYLETAGVTQPGTRLKVLSRFPSFNFKTGKLM